MINKKKRDKDEELWKSHFQCSLCGRIVEIFDGQFSHSLQTIICHVCYAEQKVSDWSKTEEYFKNKYPINKDVKTRIK